MESRPSFLIIFFPEKHTAELKIPGHVSLPLPQYVILRDRFGNTWLVEALKFEDHWYIRDGWAKFVSDSSVTIMDVLAFHYYGPGLFEVEITGSDGEIRPGVGYHKTYDPKEHEYIEIDDSTDDDTSERVSNGKNKKINAKGKKGKEVCEYQGDTETDEDLVSDDEQMAKVLRKLRKENHASTSKANQKKRSIDCFGRRTLKSGLTSKPNNSYPVKRVKPFHMNAFKKGKKSIEVASLHDKKGKGLAAKKLRANVKTSKPRLRVDYLGRKIFDSGVIQYPYSKLYFVTYQKSTRRNELVIPKGIYEDFTLPDEIMLVDPDGDQFSSWKVEWSDGRTFYKGGFNKLGNRNRLEENDLLICEFGEGDQYGLLFLSFLRGAAEILYGN